MRTRVALGVVAAVLATSAGRCGSAARNAVQASDDAARAGRVARYADDLSRAARVAPLTQTVEGRFAAIAGQLTADVAQNRETVREAVYTVAWDMFCDVIEGTLPRTRDELAEWLIGNAASFGLQFLGDSAERLAGEVITLAAGFSQPPSACGRLPDSGL